MKYKFWIYVFISGCCYLFLTLSVPIFAQENISASPAKLTLIKAVTCEDVKERSPYNPAVVFSISIGKVSCFSAFDPVPEKTFVYHNWFRMDRLSTKIRLTINPPAWSTYSNIQLREADKGPWRVEITDQEGNILDILRFSITD